MKKLIFLTFLLVSTAGLSSAFSQTWNDTGHTSSDNQFVSSFTYTDISSTERLYSLSANPEYRGSGVTVTQATLFVGWEDFNSNWTQLIDETTTNLSIHRVTDQIDINNTGFVIIYWEVFYSDGSHEQRYITYY